MPYSTVSDAERKRLLSLTPERHELGSLVDDVVGAVEEEVPENGSDDNVKRLVKGVQ